MKSLLPLLLLCFNLCLAQVDNRISIGKVDSIYSKTLKENRELWVYLPDNFNASKKYPIVYLLDGKTNFHSFTGVINHLSNTDVIPEMIVVGILNTNRNRDFTPTYDSTNYDKSNGGGEAFSYFLEKELMPYIESRYPVAPYRILVGHSLGGLWVVNTFLNYTSLFNSYIATDPSLWWDNMKLEKQSAKILMEQKFKDKILFLTMANSLPIGMTDTAQARKDNTVSTIGIRSVLLFHDVLVNTKNKELKWQFKYYENERHSSVPLISSYDAFKFIFDFYQRPSFQKVTDSTVAILENHYKMVSEKMKYQISPPEADIKGLAWRCKNWEKNNKWTLAFLEMYIKYYPNSPTAYENMGQFYMDTGDAKKAQMYFDKEKKLTKTQEQKK